MKQITKAIIGAAAVVTMASATLVPVATYAWGDNTAGGRKSYTISEINQGKLGNTITFNSISDGTIGNEKNFVAARLDDGKVHETNVWSHDSISVEDGKTYIIRLYVHNNNPNGTNATAKDVKTTFSLPTTTGKELTVIGYIDSSNATPTRYWDEVSFTASENFYLEYIEGSALLENNGIGKNGGIKLSDNVILKSGATIGYDSLNGEIPGCFQYDGVVSIKVKAHYTKKEDLSEKMVVAKKVRIKGTTEWKDSITAKIGQEVEYQIEFTNTGTATLNSVAIKDTLPANMQYVAKSTKLYNATYPNGTTLDSDAVVTNGIIIGNYTAGSNAYVRFTAKVVDSKLSCGANTLTNTVEATSGKNAVKNTATVSVTKTCSSEEIPETGATVVVSSILGLGSLTTVTGYYIASRKKLM